MSRNDNRGYASQIKNGITGYSGRGEPIRARTTRSADQGSRPRDEYGNYIDRRKPSLKSFIYGALRPRRKRISREEDREHTFLDWHPEHLLVVCACILLLSVMDGLLTVHLAGTGIKQINPVLASIFTANMALFALLKILFTAIGVTGLVVTAHMRIYNLIKASTVLYCFLGVYLWLVIYQSYIAQGI
ncbi:MAG: DUF5658 family protein [Candidatus Rariloculaceae bacterium]